MISDIDDSKAPLMEHLVELRTRLLYSLGYIIVAFFVCFAFSAQIYDFLAAPLERAMGVKTQLISTEVTGQLWVRLEVAIYAALMVTFPFVANQVWKFVAPGLYRHEKKALLPFMVMTPVLFGAGVTLAYLMMPLALKALLLGPFSLIGEGAALNLAITPDVQKYLSFVRQILFAFGFSFLLPILLLLLNRAGILPLETMVKGRRYAIVIAFVIAAIITPPDVLSQLMLAIPLALLYELTIIMARIIGRRAAAQTEAEPQSGTDVAAPKVADTPAAE